MGDTPGLGEEVVRGLMACDGDVFLSRILTFVLRSILRRKYPTWGGITTPHLIPNEVGTSESPAGAVTTGVSGA